jgi:hypothetical protein
VLSHVVIYFAQETACSVYKTRSWACSRRGGTVAVAAGRGGSGGATGRGSAGAAVPEAHYSWASFCGRKEARNIKVGDRGFALRSVAFGQDCCALLALRFGLPQYGLLGEVFTKAASRSKWRVIEVYRMASVRLHAAEMNDTLLGSREGDVESFLQGREYDA